ncbi:hypothetical protein BC830DRAFT_1121148 [Chytriomyces sp. MP71]|nr:hypothetical protein BC830DRAFT_1121148 [Chytriomyces sp. MP71]
MRAFAFAPLLPRPSAIRWTWPKPSLRMQSLHTFSVRALSGSAYLRSQTHSSQDAAPRTKSKKKGVRSVGLSAVQSLDHRIIRRATAFSVAENYRFEPLLVELQERYKLLPFIADDVYHVRLSPSSIEFALESTDSSLIETETDPGSEAFFFNNGVLVTWGASDSQIEELLLIANSVGESLYKDLEVEWFDYVVDPDHSGGIVNDTIVIGSDLPQDQYKLAFSSGLARSAKLASLENLLDAHLDKNKEIPDLLLRGKRLPLSRSTILKSLGELFSLRGHVNLHSELLDLPDFCWSSSQMEDAFSEISRNLDVRARIAIFNKKLDYANELAEVLRNHLHEEHSLKLEWCIIILISVEIAFEVVHFVDRWREQIEEDERLARTEAEAQLAQETRRKLVAGLAEDEVIVSGNPSLILGSGTVPINASDGSE